MKGIFALAILPAHRISDYKPDAKMEEAAVPGLAWYLRLRTRQRIQRPFFV